MASYRLCRELGFASPRHLLGELTGREFHEWLAFLMIEADDMNPDKQNHPPEAAWAAWVGQAAAAQQKGGA